MKSMIQKPMAWTNKQHKNRPNATRLNKKSLATIFKEIICIAPADHSANHSTNQPARQPANQPANQPTTKLANQPADWPTSPPINQPAGKSVSLTVSHPASQPSLARHQARQATNPAQPTTQLRPPWANQPSYARAAQPGSPAQPSLAANKTVKARKKSIEQALTYWTVCEILQKITLEKKSPGSPPPKQRQPTNNQPIKRTTKEARSKTVEKWKTYWTVCEILQKNTLEKKNSRQPTTQTKTANKTVKARKKTIEQALSKTVKKRGTYWTVCEMLQKITLEKKSHVKGLPPHKSKQNPANWPAIRPEPATQPDSQPAQPARPAT